MCGIIPRNREQYKMKTGSPIGDPVYIYNKKEATFR